MLYASWVRIPLLPPAFLAQLVERKTFNLVVVGSSPTEGTFRGNMIVRIIFFPNTPTIFCVVRRSSIAQLAERSAVNR